jgi:hypothetical protein
VLWLSAVLIAAVSNLDNLTVGVAFGMRESRIAAAPNVVIAAVTMAAIAGAMTSGHALSRVLPPFLAAAVGASIIGAIGVWTVLASLRVVRLPDSSTEPGLGERRGGRYLVSGELDRESESIRLHGYSPEPMSKKRSARSMKGRRAGFVQRQVAVEVNPRPI